MPAKLRPHAASATVVPLALILGLAVAGLVALSGAEAAGQGQPKCGDTITADTTLHHNLVNCPNNGIVIGADGITVDLNGHRIDGDGIPAAGCNPETDWCDVGVLNDGHNGVTVRDGSMRDFDLGAVVGEARHNRLLRISASRNLSFGILMFAAARSSVRDSSASWNIPREGDGMGLFASHHVRILENSFRHNPGPGIHLADSTNTLIRENMFVRNGPGILVEANRNEVRHNRLTRGGGILIAAGNGNVIFRNRVSRAADSLAVENGHGNLVARNLVARARGDGIRLGIQPPPIGGDHNVVRRNRVRESSGDGFLVNQRDDHSLLKRNLARRSGDDGFDIESHSTKLTRNRARRNGDLGIEAVRGVRDGGGNKASGNGDPRQCTHIVCR